jgi:non-heme chloroperoxidase
MDDTPVQGQIYKARKGDVELFTWRKRLGSTRAPTLLLVHGSSLSSLPTFDLAVPGKPDYSMMDWFARRGFDVWTCDHEAYGRSTLTQSNSDVASGVADLESVSELIRRETGLHRMYIYGLSSGALRAAAFASAHPERVDRLALDGFVWTGEGSPTLAKRKEGVEYFRTHNRRPIDQTFIESIFLRDHPGTSDPDVIRACAAAQLAYADSVPTGSYLDMTCHLPLVDPANIPVPTLVARGEYDGIASMSDLLAFFDRLPRGDKQFSVVPALAHLTSLGLERRKMWKVIRDFLEN